MIHDVIVHPLTVHADERGFLMEILRESDTYFARFGQVYVSKNYPGVIRAWHYHKNQTDLWAVVDGNVKAVMFDMRESSPTFGVVQEVYIGADHPVVLVIPPGIAHGYKTIGIQPSLLLNFADRLYDPANPDEYRIPYDSPDIPYNWEIRIT